MGVDWNERVINVHEGGWNYVANSVGVAPGTFLEWQLVWRCEIDVLFLIILN